MARMDETNLHLLHLLQRNGRATIADLAQAVNRSESAVRERITALELGGFVQGYQARVDWGLMGLPARAVIRARCDPRRMAEARDKLAAIPNVIRAVLLTGQKPILAILWVRDLQHLHTLLRDRLSGILYDIEAEITLETLVEDRYPSLLDLAGNAQANTSPSAPHPSATAATTPTR